MGRRTGETSRDSGRTWEIVFDNMYHPWRGSLPPISRHNGPCHQMPQYRAFDFLVGRWEVRQISRKPIGEVVIDSLLQGCALRERFHALGGETTLPFAGFDASTNLWRGLEVSDRGEVALSEGAVSDGGQTWIAANTVVYRRLAP